MPGGASDNLLGTRPLRSLNRSEPRTQIQPPGTSRSGSARAVGRCVPSCISPASFFLLSTCPTCSRIALAGSSAESCATSLPWTANVKTSSRRRAAPADAVASKSNCRTKAGCSASRYCAPGSRASSTALTPAPPTATPPESPSTDRAVLAIRAATSRTRAAVHRDHD